MKHPIIATEEIPESGSKVVEFFGREVHVYRVDGKARAVANACLHFGGPLDFDPDNCKFTCQWHQASFDAKKGNKLGGPAPSDSRLMFISTIEEDGYLTYVWGE